jgi:hypothetical protein
MSDYQKGFGLAITLPRDCVSQGDLVSFGGEAKYTVIQVRDWSDIYDGVELDRALEADIFIDDFRIVGVFGRLQKEKDLLTLRVRTLEDELERTKKRISVLWNQMRDTCVQEGGHFDNGAMFHGFCQRCGECLG